MHVALVYTDHDFYAGMGYDEAWERALAEQGATVTRVPRLDGAPPRADLCIPHVLNEEVAVFGETLQAAAVYEALGTPMLNPLGALLAAADKRTNAAVWDAHGVPQPATYDPTRLQAWPRPGEPMVLKPAQGDGARDVVLVERVDEVPDDGRPYVLQEWIREPRCLRLFATPQTVSKAYEKDREPGALVTHGTVYPHVYDAPPEVAALARRMIATLGGGLMGVDVLLTQDGRALALEANAPFGFDVTDPEQGRFVARAALEHARRRSPSLAAA
jgi:glutathione synthase/RimK-type ligase-like ATP-grasp enzyme